jgi:hypothetical protein
METRLVRSVDIIQHAIDSTAAPLAIFSISINSLSVYTVSSILTLGNFLFFFFLPPLILSKISDGSDFHYRYSSSSIKLLFRFSKSNDNRVEIITSYMYNVHICRAHGFWWCVQLRQIDGRDIDQVFPVSFGYLT